MDASFLTSGDAPGSAKFEDQLETIGDSLSAPLLANDPSDRPWLAEGSIKASIFNLTNATLGAGIVSVPYAMMSLGLGPGTLTLLLLGFASVIATKALVQVLNYTSVTSFEQMALLAGGPHLSLLVQIIMVLFNFGAAIGYLICMGDVYEVILSAYSIHPPSHFGWILSRELFLVLVCCFVLLPLSLVDKLSKLRLASLFGLAALELLVVVAVVLLCQKGAAPDMGPFPYGRSFLPKNMRGPLRGIPLLVFAFSCHSNAPSIYVELENHSYRRMVKVASRSVLVALVTYFLMGVAGFLLFGYHVESNVLTNFTSELRHNISVLIAFIGILLGVVLSYPMNIFPCRSALEMAFYPNGLPSPTTSTAITVMLVATSLAVALTIPSLAIIFSLTGSTCGASVAFILPGIFVLRLIPGRYTHYRKFRALILVIVGVIIAVFGTGVSLLELFHPPVV